MAAGRDDGVPDAGELGAGEDGEDGAACDAAAEGEGEGDADGSTRPSTQIASASEEQAVTEPSSSTTEPVTRAIRPNSTGRT
ncbi:hypothetical protein BXY51_002484 [Actinoplanes cyaneus]|nr:hypothetical protein [Actinoplanes cyaneus]